MGLPILPERGVGKEDLPAAKSDPEEPAVRVVDRQRVPRAGPAGFGVDAVIGGAGDPEPCLHGEVGREVDRDVGALPPDSAAVVRRDVVPEAKRREVQVAVGDAHGGRHRRRNVFAKRPALGLRGVPSEAS